MNVLDDNVNAVLTGIFVSFIWIIMIIVVVGTMGDRGKRDMAFSQECFEQLYKSGEEYHDMIVVRKNNIIHVGSISTLRYGPVEFYACT